MPTGANQRVSTPTGKGAHNLNADIVVNAANIDGMQPSGWGGVAGAIYNGLDQKGKNTLRDRWNTNQSVGPGRAVTSTDRNGQPHAYQFKQHNKPSTLIHAGSPKNTNPSGGLNQTQEAQLTNAYLNALQEADKASRSPAHAHKPQVDVAIPPLGVGIYNVPPEQSADCAARALAQFQAQNPSNRLNVQFPIYNTQANSVDMRFKSRLDNQLNRLQNTQAAPVPQTNVQPTLQRAPQTYQGGGQPTQP